MQLDYIQEFLDLAGTLSFTRTAENLSLSQPTLSRHIAELERRVGARLFDRSTNSVRLTRAGKTFYQTANAMTASYNEMLGSIKGMGGADYPVVRCGGSTFHPAVNRTFTWLAGQAVVKDLPVRFEYGKTRAFASESPSIYSIDLLQSGELDLVVEALHDDSPNLAEYNSCTVAREPFVVIASSNNALAAKSSLRIDDLEGQRALTLAMYPHCPGLMTSPYRIAGIKMRDYQTFFIGDLLELTEHLCRLEDDQVVLMQKGFHDYFRFTAGDMGHTTLLDMDDDRLVVQFKALSRKDDASPALGIAWELLSTLNQE